ncbi:MAG: hypothetical protein DMG89_06710 [Acidobacteria bacterium]|nr:MAG: hypothetical protein DMG89_06710 [Acidobacteriota bacterium]
MSLNEVRTRMGQEVGKRIDVVRYRTNLLAIVKPLSVPPQKTGNFFFSASELPSRARLLHENLRTETELILQEADKICDHHYSLLGYTDLDYGPKIDWHLDPVHGQRAPLKPWFKINFLNFAEVGDHKVIWELNRHQHLTTLAKAWCFTRQENYVREMIAQWYCWQHANPYPLGINWASSLEVAFRSLSWLWMRHLVAGCPAVPEKFDADLLQALALNARHIERFLSTYFSPNTHLLGEAVALLFVGTLCPQLPAAANWRDYGWRTVIEQAERQVRPDGLHFEQSLYYHVYALDFFLHSRQLAIRNQLQIPDQFDRILGRMLDVLEILSQSGQPEGFGDDDGGRVFNPRRNRAEHMTDSLAIGAAAFGRPTSAASLTEEAVWLFGEQACSSSGGKSPTLTNLQSRCFEAGGVYVMASKSASAQMMIDCGPQGPGRSGHGHADALSIRMSLNGRRWLVDPGTFGYVSDDNARNFFRGTGAHNTLKVDGMDQAIPEGPFSWSSIPEVRPDLWCPGVTFTLFSGSHTGYACRPGSVLHRRFVFFLHGEFWLVCDFADGRGSHQLEVFWHLAPDLAIVRTELGFITGPLGASLATDSDEVMRLALVPAEDSAWNSELLPGYVSPCYGKKEPAPVLRVSGHIALPADCAMLLLPLKHPSDRPGKLSPSVKRASPVRVRAYRYEGAESTHYIVFANHQQAWTLGSLSSDARFLYCAIKNSRMAHFVLCRGSFASINAHQVFCHHCSVERFEWTSSGGQVKSFSSDEGVVRSFANVALEFRDSVF